jgi:hypothetical protein
MFVPSFFLAFLFYSSSSLISVFIYIKHMPFSTVTRPVIQQCCVTDGSHGSGRYIAFQCYGIGHMHWATISLLDLQTSLADSSHGVELLSLLTNLIRNARCARLADGWLDLCNLSRLACFVDPILR